MPQERHQSLGMGIEGEGVTRPPGVSTQGLHPAGVAKRCAEVIHRLEEQAEVVRARQRLDRDQMSVVLPLW